MDQDNLTKEYEELKRQFYKDRYQRCKAQIQASQKEYRKRNWEKVKATQYAWQKRNPEKYAEVRARAIANRILKDEAFRLAHPEIWTKNAQGKWRTIRPPKSTPAEREARRLARSKAQWQKDKLDPVKVLAHRNRALVYAHKVYHQKKKQRLQMKLISVLQNYRIKKLKEDLYANIQVTRGGSRHNERIPPLENKGEIRSGASRWSEALWSPLKKRLSKGS